MPLSLEFGEAELIWQYFLQHPRVGTMIDVGAQFGTSFREYLRAGWRVVAFEPDPAKLPKLQKYMNDPRFTLYTQGVGDVARSDVPFFTSDESTGISSLIPFRASHQETTRINIVTLSSVLADLDLAALDYLKVDTEGNDYRVIRGFPWDRLKPEVVLCEFDEVKTRGLGFDYRTLGDFLVAQGYAVWMSEWYPLERYGSGHRWRRIASCPALIADPNSWGNFIAVRSDAGVPAMNALVAMHGSGA